MGVPAAAPAPIIEDEEEPTAPGGRRRPPRPGAVEAEALEHLAGAVKTLGFRVALLVPELRQGPMPDRVRGRLGQNLRELGALCAETAAAVDPR